MRCRQMEGVAFRTDPPLSGRKPPRVYGLGSPRKARMRMAELLSPGRFRLLPEAISALFSRLTAVALTINLNLCIGIGTFADEGAGRGGLWEWGFGDPPKTPKRAGTREKWRKFCYRQLPGASVSLRAHIRAAVSRPTFRFRPRH